MAGWRAPAQAGSFLALDRFFMNVISSRAVSTGMSFHGCFDRPLRVGVIFETCNIPLPVLKQQDRLIFPINSRS
ncbi:hypothetical protein CO659_00355 [Rhizobium sp. S9]|nr:hypothetical protein CO659_00355 [Rhizobium sp. S9]